MALFTRPAYGICARDFDSILLSDMPFVLPQSIGVNWFWEDKKTVDPQATANM